jgi:hypothetical protein
VLSIRAYERCTTPQLRGSHSVFPFILPRSAAVEALQLKSCPVAETLRFQDGKIPKSLKIAQLSASCDPRFIRGHSRGLGTTSDSCAAPMGRTWRPWNTLVRRLLETSKPRCKRLRGCAIFRAQVHLARPASRFFSKGAPHELHSLEISKLGQHLENLQGEVPSLMAPLSAVLAQYARSRSPKDSWRAR